MYALLGIAIGVALIPILAWAFERSCQPRTLFKPYDRTELVSGNPRALLFGWLILTGGPALVALVAYLRATL